MKKKRLLIIPAKSKSKRIKNKNFKNFLGKPIIIYPYKIAKKSRLFDKIHISTEDSSVIKKLSGYNIKIDFLRDKKLASGETPLLKVIKFVVNKYKELKFSFDEIWIILPCSPLLEVSDLLKLNNLISKKKIKTPVISVSKYPVPIEWSFNMNKNLNLKPVNIKNFKYSSKKFKEKYFDVGVLTVLSQKDIFTNNQYSIFKKLNGFEMSREKAVDIDTDADWKFAELLKKNVYKN